LEAGNSLISNVCTFPWLQDVVSVNAWSTWLAAKDNLFIVDSLGRQLSMFPIGVYDLTDLQNRDALKKLLLNAAVIKDSNKDGLPDDWIQQYMGGVTAKPSEDIDGDGRDNFTEYAFGINPKDPESTTPIKVSVGFAGSDRVISIVFYRRAGSVLNYYIETSTDLLNWTTVTSDMANVSAPRNLYDGTGTSEVRATLKATPGDSFRYVRVRAVPR
jgi:hypothetical protein